jgi:TonB family protein
MGGKMKRAISLIFAGLFFLSVAQAQEKQHSQAYFPRWIGEVEAQQLTETLKTTTSISIDFENLEKAPLTITAAKLKIVKRETPESSKSGQNHQDSYPYAVEEEITLINKTDRPITKVMLRFAGLDGGESMEIIKLVVIEPFGSYIMGAAKHSTIDYYYYEVFPLDPSKATVKILEVKFEDGTRWEKHPTYPEDWQVDVMPIPLTKPNLTYTEEAWKNRIQGPVVMRLLISVEGEVKQAKIITGLPDGLNEIAKREAKSLKFKPATKDGQAIECWVSYEMNFLLRGNYELLKGNGVKHLRAREEKQ